MTETLEYALMAGNAYQSTVGNANKTPFPAGLGWQILPGGLDYIKDPQSGFEATAYIKGKEIVISFAGTGPGSFIEQPDWWANVQLTLGIAEAQLLAAASYYATKGTGHLLDANRLISFETNFKSSEVVGRRGR